MAIVGQRRGAAFPARHAALDGCRVEVLQVLELYVPAFSPCGSRALVENAAVADHDDTRGLAHLVERDNLGGQLGADAAGIAHGQRNDGFFQFHLLQGPPSARRGIHVVIAGK